MEKQDHDSIQAFDARYTTGQLQLLKIFLPFCPPDVRRSMVVMIRFMEFRHTLSYVRTHPEAFREEPVPFSLNDLCERMKDHCSPELRSMLEQLQSMQNMMQMYEEMQQMMEIFRAAEETATDNAGEEGKKAAEGSGMDPVSMLSGLLTPEQMEMFQMFQSDFGARSQTPPDKEE